MGLVGIDRQSIEHFARQVVNILGCRTASKVIRQSYKTLESSLQLVVVAIMNRTQPTSRPKSPVGALTFASIRGKPSGGASRARLVGFARTQSFPAGKELYAHILEHVPKIPFVEKPIDPIGVEYLFGRKLTTCLHRT